MSAEFERHKSGASCEFEQIFIHLAWRCFVPRLTYFNVLSQTAFHVSFQDNALAKKRDVIISRITSIVSLQTESHVYKCNIHIY